MLLSAAVRYWMAAGPYIRIFVRFGALALLPAGFGLLAAPDHNWNSHAEVAKKVMDKFEAAKTYTAQFSIRTAEGRSVRNLTGTLYYQKPGKVRFAFTQPAGNLMVSDGKILWVYIRSINAAGKQDLTLKTVDESKRPVFAVVPGPGLSRLFRKYHYRFDGTQQPRTEDGRSVFVLDLEQREKIGGFERMKLHVDPKTFLIVRADADDGQGKQSQIRLSDIRMDVSLDGKLFQFDPGSARVVDNPLVNE